MECESQQEDCNDEAVLSIRLNTARFNAEYNARYIVSYEMAAGTETQFVDS